MRRHAQDGKEHPRKAFVFGNDAGERVKSIRTAWEKTCKRAGIDPRELHFHDLRANLLLGCWNRRQTCTTCATSSELKNATADVKQWGAAGAILALLLLVVWTGYGQGQRPSAGPARETWEYDILYNGVGINPAFEQQLNQRGAQGGELVAVGGDFCYFKRGR